MAIPFEELVGKWRKEHFEDDESSEDDDSDKELQIAFQQGLIKPGLNIPDFGIQSENQKPFVNRPEGVLDRLSSFQLNLPWKERLDITCEPAEESDLHKDEVVQSKLLGEDVNDESRRQLLVYRQAQAAVLLALPRLHELSIPTKRPDDFFAEMLKPDDLMKKVRERLVNRKVALEKTERVKKMRQTKQFGKKVQQEVLLQKQRDKKMFKESVRSFRKGNKSALDFIDDESSTNRKGKARRKVDQPPRKSREARDKKFGFGGQKKKSKWNTKQSSREVDTPKSSRRPGKDQRQKSRSRKR